MGCKDILSDILKLPGRSACSFSYDVFFGLGSPFVQPFLEMLPGAEKCFNYKFKKIDVKVTPQEINRELPENPSGCARTEKFKKQTSEEKFHFLANVHTGKGIVASGVSGDAPVSSSDTTKLRRGGIGDGGDLPVAAQYRQFKNSFKKLTRVGRSEIHGRGLFSVTDLEKDQLIIEYVGELIRSKVADVRERYYDSKGIGCYMFRIDENFVVDATKMGNAARYVNHSCDPNCEARVITVGTSKKIVIYASKAIPLGVELTYDYKFPIEDDKLKCHCKAWNCRGTMN